MGIMVYISGFTSKHAGCHRSAFMVIDYYNNRIVDGHQPRGPIIIIPLLGPYTTIIIISSYHHIIISLSSSSSSSSSICSNLPLRQSWVWPTIIFLGLRIAIHQSQDRKGWVLPKGSSWKRFCLYNYIHVTYMRVYKYIETIYIYVYICVYYNMYIIYLLITIYLYIYIVTYIYNIHIHIIYIYMSFSGS